MSCTGKKWDETLPEWPDKKLIEILESHKNPSFWDRRWVGSPSKAYVRNWSSRVRREARSRGLL